MNKRFNIELGKAIKQAREEKGMTQQMLADRLSVSRSCVANWEQGTRNIYMDQFVKACEILQIDADELIRTLTKYLYSK